MNLHPEPVARYCELIDSAAPQLPGRGLNWLAGRRALAVKQLMERGLPNRKDEAWRYTSLDRLTDQDWSIQTGAFSALTDLDIEEFQLDGAAAARLVFANGRWVAGLSDIGRLGGGIHVHSLRQILDENPALVAPWLGTATGSEHSAFAALNTALIDDGVCIHISANTRLSGPIEVLYVAIGVDTPPVISPRNLIVLGERAEATILEHYAGLGGASPSFTNSLTEVVLGRNARLEHIRLQDEGPAARHLSQVHLRQDASSHYRGFGISLGGLWARTEYHNRLAQSGARCELDGLYIAGDRQLNDVHLNIIHAAPGCSSRERFNGLLSGRGRAVFDGRIRVDVDAQKTDAQLVNDNLLLSRDAEIDTKPQLEIYADDVKCSHGTTVGQLEPAQLFYLRARGIGADEARRMLCLGFALEVLEDCAHGGVRARVEQRLRRQLAQPEQVVTETQ